MNLPTDAADLTLAFCSVILMLGTLLIWAIHTADRSVAVQRVMRTIWRSRE